MRRRSTVSRAMALVGGLVLLGSSAVARPSGFAAAAPNGPHPAFAHPAVTHRTAVSRGHVVLQDAARTSKVHRGIQPMPAIRPLRTPATPGPRPRGSLPTPPVQATTTAAVPAAVTGFGGVTEKPALPDPSVEPPDPYLAVGPDDVMQAVNLFVRVTDRNGGTPLDSPLFDFFY